VRTWGPALIAAWLAVMGAAPAARAATINVTTSADSVANDGKCSLREAIIASNTLTPSGAARGECPAGSGADTISLPAGKYTLTAGPLNVTGDLTIVGAGASSTSIDGGGASRVLTIQPSAIVSLNSLTITHGHAPDGAAAMMGQPGSAGQPGGGIDTSGALTLTSVVVSGNTAGDGSKGGFTSQGSPGPTGGAGGGGGGIFNSGTLTVLDSTITGNKAGLGGAGADSQDYYGGSGAAGGSGGGILSTSAGSLTITATTISGNHAGSGGAGGAGSSEGGPAGAGGTGGGVQSSGKLALAGSLLVANLAGGGGNGGLSPIALGGAGGNGGDGGGLFDAAATSQTIVDDTVTGNRAGSGGDGGNADVAFAGGYAGSGGGGGGIVSAGAALDVVNATIGANLVGDAGNPGSGPEGSGSAGTAGSGGGISAYGSIKLQNTIVSGNSGTNCLGVTTDGGHNISYPDSGNDTPGDCVGTNVNPKLGPLSDNGGPTETMALLPGSPAIDGVPAAGANCPATDQRGVTRPQGQACDIGAYEAAAPVNSGRPVITGAPQPAATLMCSTGAWINFPLTFSYLWVRDGTAIPGATNPSYKVTVADGGHSIVCQVTGSNQTSMAEASSASVLIKRLPVLSNLKLQRTAFSHRTKITYDDSVSGATTTFVVMAERRAHHHTKSVRLGSFTHRDRAGKNTVVFNARLAGHELKPGSYRIVATASLAGISSRSLTTAFRIEG
jgi:CSLREA domain-containing protein